MPYYVPQRLQNRVQQNRFQRPRLIQGQRKQYSNSQIHRPQSQSNQQRYQPVDNQFQCFYCGTNCQFKPQCPARNVVCHLCNKINICTRVCQSPRRVTPQIGIRARSRFHLEQEHTSQYNQNSKNGNVVVCNSHLTRKL
jgi:hypothetical protein